MTNIFVQTLLKVYIDGANLKAHEKKHFWVWLTIYACGFDKKIILYYLSAETLLWNLIPN